MCKTKNVEGLHLTVAGEKEKYAAEIAPDDNNVFCKTAPGLTRRHIFLDAQERNKFDNYK